MKRLIGMLTLSALMVGGGAWAQSKQKTDECCGACDMSAKTKTAKTTTAAKTDECCGFCDMGAKSKTAKVAVAAKGSKKQAQECCGACDMGTASKTAKITANKKAANGECCGFCDMSAKGKGANVAATAKIGAVKTTTFEVSEMMCEGCVSSLRNTLAKTNGVKSFSADVKTKKVTVTYDPKVTSPDAVATLSRQTLTAKMSK